MKIKVSDYIANFLVEKGLTNVFTVPGGGAMHLNDSLGHHPSLKSIYNHHEQASAIAAEGYARVNNKPAILCVTSGPGGVNALNGVAGAYMDSIPMIVLSGQVKRILTTRYTGSKVRALGSQEFDIVSAVGGMTKYAEMIIDSKKLKYCLEKAYHLATTGRMGPCWLDIPLDIQGSYVDTDDFVEYVKENEYVKQDNLQELADKVIEKLKNAQRPVLYAGNGIRLSGGVDLLHKVAEKYGLPVVTCWDSIDLIASYDKLFCGRAGTMGDRAGNFAVQNSDLLICIGNRLNSLQIGYDLDKWARAAYTVVVDIDKEELMKPTIRVDLPICSDASEFMTCMLDSKIKVEADLNSEWLNKCEYWKNKYPVVLERQKNAEGYTNVYAFIDSLSRLIPEGALTVVANGSASVVGSQSFYMKNKSRFIMNCAFSSMGYDLPAAEGVCMASDGNTVYCIAGDGSMMMNIQELQTISTNKMPIKIFVINNEGYHQVRQTQNNIFKNQLIGVGPESGDLGFPNFEKLSDAFGLPYLKIESNSELNKVINKMIEHDGPILCEVHVSIDQIFEPKLSTKKLPDGTLVSPPLEDLSPFISREELAENMYIPLVD